MRESVAISPQSKQGKRYINGKQNIRPAAGIHSDRNGAAVTRLPPLIESSRIISMKTAYIAHNDCARHDMGAGHPESPFRLQAIAKAVDKANLRQRLDSHEAPMVKREHLERVHPAPYIDRVIDASPDQGLHPLDGDTAMNPHSLEAAYRAAGGAVFATELVLEGKVDHAFCGTRPPGHHAERTKAMGFCFFDNVAVAAAHALENEHINKVAILDFDVHHGNGTEDIFGEDDRVLFGSTFQHPLYPYKGAEGGKNPLTINVPLPSGTDGESYRKAVKETWLPAVEEFEPDMYFISAGFDAHRDDPLASLRLLEEDFHWITREICHWAKRHANGRVVSTLEGGYNLDALGTSVVAHMEALLAD